METNLRKYLISITDRIEEDPIVLYRKFIQLGLIADDFTKGGQTKICSLLKYIGSELGGRVEHNGLYYNLIRVNKYTVNLLKSVYESPYEKLVPLLQVKEVVNTHPPTPKAKEISKVSRRDVTFYYDRDCDSIEDLYDAIIYVLKPEDGGVYELFSYTDSKGYLAFTGALKPVQNIPDGVETSARNDYLLYNNSSSLSWELRKNRRDSYGKLEACYITADCKLFSVYESCITSFSLLNDSVTYMYHKSVENLTALLVATPVPLLWGAFHKTSTSATIAKARQ
jgi:hypothetical protein